MALISCISCGARISDKAVACPKCGATDQSAPPLANTEELRIEEERKKAEEAGEKISFVQVVFPLIVFITTACIILLQLPDSTWVECGEEYWDYDRERYVRKKC